MPQPAVVLLPVFGSKPGDEWFRNAFTRDINKIYQRMEDVSNGKTGGHRAKDPKVQPLLKDTFAKLRPLALPNGAHFRDPRLKTDSHFQRPVNPGWGTGKELKKSWFRLHGWPIVHLGPGGIERQVPWWNSYDL
ncbi:hypothetical protein HRG_006219 [Hirsutella rhossiliensis]|uniref:Uncharacterized protein n=1 Tax=Hirsutella rhossiliensis TaxID=111463 RepID=A0A9P8SIZ8_9HYPO|nr:uncharacterized protein HRG_06219 [Hirsutella rhossiliensis]KAH0963709.1 hypothetical protein HRG_06219 [Hirsutella rhossiliensis]